MAKVSKIDSNITGLAYAEEAQLGVLPGEGSTTGTPEWYQLEPNSYSDFGGEITTVAPNPINPSRQRRKGVTTDLDASGGLNHNLTFTNLTHLMQGMMFADVRRKGRKTVSAIVDTDTFTADSTGVLVGDYVKPSAFVQSANNKLQLVTAVGTSEITVSGGLVAETPTGIQYLDVVGHKFAAGALSVDVSGSLPRILSSTFDLTTLGLVPGQWIYVGSDDTALSFTNVANNGYKRIRSVTASEIVIDKSYQPMSAEAAATVTLALFYGDVLRNETGALIKRRSYNVERLLGAPDSALPSQIQSEVLKGAVPNEFTLNVPSADLVNVDFSFVATDNEQRESTLGPKQASVKTFPVAKEYNSSSDVGRIRISMVDSANPSPDALFAYVTEAKITINNNVSANKAIGVLGAFDVTAGTFEVSGSVTAYFSTVSATKAVRNNADITLDLALVKNNTGIIYDMPLVALGDGRLSVEIDQPITLPLNTDAASGQDVADQLNHTLLITYFNYLPDGAM